MPFWNIVAKLPPMYTKAVQSTPPMMYPGEEELTYGFFVLARGDRHEDVHAEQHPRHRDAHVEQNSELGVLHALRRPRQGRVDRREHRPCRTGRR